FQEEDGIRDFHVTGVQTCALPISTASRAAPCTSSAGVAVLEDVPGAAREAVGQVVDVALAADPAVDDVTRAAAVLGRDRAHLRGDRKIVVEGEILLVRVRGDTLGR